MPPSLPANAIPSGACYLRKLKNFASARADDRSQFFKLGAFRVISAHVYATILAAIAIAHLDSPLLPALLILELLLLIRGFWIHNSLHDSDAAKHWSMARLSAEIARSAVSLSRLHNHLDHLFVLPFDNQMRALLRTINVLHLRDARHGKNRPWKKTRDGYLRKRVKHQLRFYEDRARGAEIWLARARWAFFGCSLLAIVAAVAKLSLKIAHSTHFLEAACGPLAIMLPVLAVGALSLAAAFDLEARAHTFREMAEFLEEQVPLLTKADSEREFVKLALETESRLLGETANWFARGAFRGVA